MPLLESLPSGVQGGRVEPEQTDELGQKQWIQAGIRKDRSTLKMLLLPPFFHGDDSPTKKITTTPSGRAFEYIENQSGTDFIDPGEVSELFS